jgi:uncharacterized membrane protein
MSMSTTPKLGIEKSILIDAPLERVFAYYAEPENMPEIWPSLLEVKDVQRDDDGYATHFRWVYKMAGMRFEGSTVITSFEKNRMYTTEGKGGIESTFETYFEDRGGKTLLRESVRYHVPVPLLGRVAERFLAKSNEHEIETIHKNLKARLEAEPGA